MPLTVKEWLKEHYPHPHDGFVIPSPEMVQEYAEYYHAELSKPLETDISIAIAERAQTWILQNDIDKMPVKDFVNTVLQLCGYYHDALSMPSKDVEAAIEAYEDVALKMYNEQSMGFAEVVSKAVLHGYSLAGNQAIEFLDQIRDYERESGNAICYDERTSEELYKICKSLKKKDNG